MENVSTSYSKDSHQWVTGTDRGQLDRRAVEQQSERDGYRALPCLVGKSSLLHGPLGSTSQACHLGALCPGTALNKMTWGIKSSLSPSPEGLQNDQEAFLCYAPEILGSYLLQQLADRNE